MHGNEIGVVHIWVLGALMMLASFDALPDPPAVIRGTVIGAPA